MAQGLKPIGNKLKKCQWMFAKLKKNKNEKVESRKKIENRK